MEPDALIEGFGGVSSRLLVFSVLNQEQITTLKYEGDEDTGSESVASKSSKKRKKHDTNKNLEKDANEEIAKKLRRKSPMQILF